MAAYGKSHSSKNPLSAFLFFSSVVHIVVLFVAFVIQPLVKPKPVIKTISFNLISNTPVPSAKAENPIPSPAPSPQPTAQAEPIPTPKPVQTPKATTQPVRRKETLVARASTPAPTVQKTPTPAVQAPAPVPTPSPAVQTPPAPTPIPQVQQPVAQPVASPPVRTAAQVENDSLASQVDSLLAARPKNAESAPSSSDFLAGGSWIGSPRKTLAFPNIKARIDELENQQGYGYSVTARITFTAQGWVSMVELTRASGDPRIDNIFRNELRKIRIEESRIGSVDTVIKSFVISVQ